MGFRVNKAMGKLSLAILKTLSYADFFDFPLKTKEIWRWQIASKGSSLPAIEKNLIRLVKEGRVKQKGEYYFLPGREKIVFLRRQRETFSRQKLALAQEAAGKLKRFPFVQMIGVTGALAMDNAKKDDDIDLLIITSKGRLWLARLLILLFCPLLRVKRRKPQDKKVKNKFCFNLFLDEAGLEIKEKNLFTAHEICQVKPLYNQDQAYEKFISINSWVSEYLPKAIPNSKLKIYNSKALLRPWPFDFPASFLNKIAFKIQYWYMKPKITCEKISLSQAFFHPRQLKARAITLDNLGE